MINECSGIFDISMPNVMSEKKKDMLQTIKLIVEGYACKSDYEI